MRRWAAHPANIMTRMRPLSLILMALVVALSIPEAISRKCRGAAAWAAAPIWAAVQGMDGGLSTEEALRLRIQHLEGENHQLKLQLQQQQHSQEQNGGIMAQVLAREAGLWDRFVWINVGRQTEGTQGILSRYSPVVVGTTLVGVVDYVGRRQSLVRLVTDPSCCPAVEISGRSDQQGVAVLSGQLLRLLQVQQESSSRLHINAGELRRLLQALSTLTAEGAPPMQGIMHGQHIESDPPLLHGELFSSGWVSHQDNIAETPWPKSGHALVTSGLDGVYPPGLLVGYLLELDVGVNTHPSCRFKAIPAAELNALSWLTVLAPRGFEPSDKPRPRWQEVLEGQTETT